MRRQRRADPDHRKRGLYTLDDPTRPDEPSPRRKPSAPASAHPLADQPPSQALPTLDRPQPGPFGLTNDSTYVAVHKNSDTQRELQTPLDYQLVAEQSKLPNVRVHWKWHSYRILVGHSHDDRRDICVNARSTSPAFRAPVVFLRDQTSGPTQALVGRRDGRDACEVLATNRLGLDRQLPTLRVTDSQAGTAQTLLVQRVLCSTASGRRSRHPQPLPRRRHSHRRSSPS